LTFKDSNTTYSPQPKTKQAKITELLTNILEMYNGTFEEIKEDKFATQEQKIEAIENIYIQRKNIKREIRKAYNINDVHSVNAKINYLCDIGTLTICENQTDKPSDNTRYKVNSYAIQIQLNLLRGLKK
jgi:hypothetical protein